MAIATATQFRIGGVILQSFATLRNNIVAFLLISLIVTVLTYVAIFVVALVFFGAAFMGGSSAMDTGGMGMMSALSLGFSAIVGIIVAFVVVVAINQLGVAAITYGTVQDLRGRKAGAGECLSRGLAVVLPVLGVAILSALIIIVAAAIAYAILSYIHAVIGGLVAFALAIAGFIVFWVAIPVAVIERPGVVASLTRSVSLTAGYRWQILGIYLLLIVIAIAVVIALGIVTFIIGLISGTLGSIVQFILNIGFSLVATAYIASLAAVGYYSLRATKEGADIHDIAKVFD
jgi:hypothetical protein